MASLRRGRGEGSGWLLGGLGTPHGSSVLAEEGRSGEQVDRTGGDGDVTELGKDDYRMASEIVRIKKLRGCWI